MIQTHAWTLHAGERGVQGEFRHEAITIPDIGPSEVRVKTLCGVYEGNMGHARDRSPLCLNTDRGEKQIVVGNAATVEILECGAEVTTVKERDRAIIFCNGVWDKYGYPEKIFAYDAPNTIGAFAETFKLHELQVIPLPAATAYSPEQWAAFSLRGCTAWSNLEMALHTLRGQLKETELERPWVWGWGGGVSLLELSLARRRGCRVAQLASSDERLKLIESYGIIPVDRREFEGLAYDPKQYKVKGHEEYTDQYRAAEKAFLERVAGITGGEGVHIFANYIGLPVFPVTLKALARQGVHTTAGWKAGMQVSLVLATESINRHPFVNTHYARYEQGAAAVAYAEEHGWLPPHPEHLYAWDEVPQMSHDYDAGTAGWFPTYKGPE